MSINSCPDCGASIAALKSIVWVRIQGDNDIVNVDGMLYVAVAPTEHGDLRVTTVYQCPECDGEFTARSLKRDMGIAGALEEGEEDRVLRKLRQAFDDATSK